MLARISTLVLLVSICTSCASEPPSSPDTKGEQSSLTLETFDSAVQDMNTVVIAKVSGFVGTQPAFEDSLPRGIELKIQIQSSIKGPLSEGKEVSALVNPERTGGQPVLTKEDIGRTLLLVGITIPDMRTEDGRVFDQLLNIALPYSYVRLDSGDIDVGIRFLNAAPRMGDPPTRQGIEAAMLNGADLREVNAPAWQALIDRAASPATERHLQLGREELSGK